MQINNDTVIVFDLDDTIFKEIDFVKSAYTEISRIVELQIGVNIYDELFNLFLEKKPVFDIILTKYNLKLNLKDLIDIYRYHFPKIEPVPDVINFIDKYKNIAKGFAVITDGRSVTQRNKLKSLKLLEIFNENIYISEELGKTKLEEYSFNSLSLKFGTSNFIYFADNVSKDFVMPNKYGWKTIQILDEERNIHKFNTRFDIQYQPEITIKYQDLNQF